MNGNGGPPRPLEVATRNYHWKPSAAWFRALELDVYLKTDVVLPLPVLDLGCGDGRVARMLIELGILAAPPVGVELSSRMIDEAGETGAHRALLRADAGRLPFRSESFASVVCNGVLCSIAADPSPALAEIERVLAPGGTFVATFPTDRFLESLLWSRLLRFCPPARSAYGRWMNRRQHHFTTDSRTRWRERFEDVDLEVEREAPFLSPFGGGLWSVLAMHVFRFVGLLKLVPGTEAPGGRMLARSFERSFNRETARDGNGYLLLMGRKNPSPVGAGS